jgi:hypothetical protein
MAALASCVAVLAMLLVSCGAGTRQAIASAKPTGPLYSEGAAAAVAQELIAAVPLPADTQRVSGPPRAVAGKLGRPIDIDEAKAVDRYAYWSSTDRPQAMLSFLARHGPFPKAQTSGYGSTYGKPDNWFETLAVPWTSTLAGPRQLFVSVERDGPGRFAVRVDVVVGWHARRPAGSLVPSVARWLKITVRTPAYRALNHGERSYPRATTRSVVSTDAAIVQAVARAVNALPVAEARGGSPPGCPEMGVADSQDAPRFVLTFRSSATSNDLAEVLGRSGFVCAASGAAVARITTPADPQGVQLTDHLALVGPLKGEGLTERIELAFHHSLRLVPEA